MSRSQPAVPAMFLEGLELRQLLAAGPLPSEYDVTACGGGTLTTSEFKPDGTIVVTSSKLDGSANCPEEPTFEGPLVPYLNGFRTQVGEALRRQAVATFSGEDFAGAPVGYKARINWGDGTTSGGRMVYRRDRTHFEIRGSHTYEEAGTYKVTVVLQGKGKKGSVTFDLYAFPVQTKFITNRPEVDLNEEFTAPISAFSADDPRIDVDELTATIDWMDGSKPTTGVIRRAPGSQDPAWDGPRYWVHGTHTYTSLKDGHRGFRPKVTITGLPDGEPAELWGGVYVRADHTGFAYDQRQIKAGHRTELGLYHLPALKGESASDFKLSIDWGDGTTSNGSVRANNQHGYPNDAPVRSFRLAGNHTYAEPGEYTITGTVTGPRNFTFTAPAVAHGIYTPDDGELAVTEAVPFDGKIVSFVNLDGVPLSDLRATIGWDDGTASSGVIQANDDGGFDVLGSHTYTNVKKYGRIGHVSVVIFGPDDQRIGLPSLTDVTVRPFVHVPRTTLNLEVGKTVDLLLGSFFGHNTGIDWSTRTATLHFGDTTSAQVPIIRHGKHFQIRAKLRYDHAGFYPLKVTVDGLPPATFHIAVNANRPGDPDNDAGEDDKNKKKAKNVKVKRRKGVLTVFQAKCRITAGD